MDVQARTEDANRATMLRFWELTEAGQMEGVVDLVDPEIVMEWPQSGERFSGVANALRAMRATEEKPEMAGEPSLDGCGDTWVARVPLRYGEDIYQYVGIFMLEDGRIRRSTEYFGAPFPANPARAPFTDPR